MRASVMVHIPALEMSKQVVKLVNECNHIGLTVKGSYGEGSDVLGSLYQISNQITLGLSEEGVSGQGIFSGESSGCRRRAREGRYEA